MTPAPWKDRRVFITGGTGMIGSWLVKELLSQGAAVVALVFQSDPNSELYRSGNIKRAQVEQGTVQDFATVSRIIGDHGIDTVFHLGAQTIVGTAYEDPLPTLETNIRGTYNILEACRTRRDTVRRIVLASSDKAYGEQRQLPYTEESPLQGRFPYDVSKSCADLIGQMYYHAYRLPIGITRCANVYGGGDLNWSRIVPGTIRSFLKREPPVIRSNGTYVRDYLYVKDAAGAYLRLAEKLHEEGVAGQAFNFSAETPVSVLDMVALIQRLMGCGDLKPDIRNCAEGEIHSQYLSIAKAKRVLAWEPKFTMEKGLAETIGWYREFLQR